MNAQAQTGEAAWQAVFVLFALNGQQLDYGGRRVLTS